ncbi:VOC family protein [Phenylobacterium montanum]|uniref:VOC family protein n=1 Tax=Phenylobacterium montanum TaxID=2823693 RepID=A0A975G3I1_9CAUL|nr:VOC family protein [Caulobacter sp. S6]QUD90463.1 VOC family protein [Caulobacter sp. S6]
MSEPHGSFTWYELMAPDAKAAAAFYGAVVGWTAQEMPSPEGPPYTVLQVGDRGVAGIMVTPKDAGGPGPVWIGYVSVPDVDAYVERLKAAGGSVHRPPFDVPGVLRLAVVADPQGAVFCMHTPYSDAPAPPALPSESGYVAWRELMAADGEKAFAFYSQMFGWTKGESHDMGPMGIYQLFVDGGETVGGMMTKPANLPSPFWSFYFNVDGVRAGVDRLKAAGGVVINGPHQVPGGQWIVQAQDPQGAMFCLVSANE